MGSAIVAVLAGVGSVVGGADDEEPDTTESSLPKHATLTEAVQLAQRELARPLPHDTLGSIIRGICDHDVDTAAAAAVSLVLTVDLDELVLAARRGADAYCPASTELNGSSARDVNLAAASLAGIPIPGSDAGAGAITSTSSAPATTPAPPTTPAPGVTQPPSQPAAGETVSQRNACKKAADYLDYTAFSRTGLIQQLEYEGYSHADAVYGTDAQGADWNEQAAKKAADYLEYTSFSRTGLIEQLMYEGFSRAEAEYGANAVGL